MTSSAPLATPLTPLVCRSSTLVVSSPQSTAPQWVAPAQGLSASMRAGRLSVTEITLGLCKSLTINDLRGQGPPRAASAW